MDKISNKPHYFLNKALQGIKEFNSAYTFFIYDHPKLIIFPCLLVLLTLLKKLTGIEQHLIEPLITHNFILEALTFSFSSSELPLIFLMVFAASVISYATISLNAALSLYVLRIIHDQPRSITRSLRIGFKKSFKALIWVLIVALITILLEKIYGPYGMSSFLCLLYIINLILWFTFVTCVTIDHILFNKSFISSIKNAFKIIAHNFIKLLGIFTYLTFLSAISLLGRCANLLTIHYSQLYIISYIIYIPIFIVVLFFSFIILNLFVSTTILATHFYAKISLD